jgi:hypothetical protein
MREQEAATEAATEAAIAVLGVAPRLTFGARIIDGT